MKNYKKDMIQFLVWMRNGIAFCTSWFLILWLVYNHCLTIENISTDSLIKMIFFVVGGVFIFSLIFTRVLIRKWSFLRRLTCFIVLISIYECIVFYYTGLWGRSGTPVEWLAFIGIVLILYFLCIAIYRIYSKRKGAIYTLALQEYQQKRSIKYGE